MSGAELKTASAGNLCKRISGVHLAGNRAAPTDIPHPLCDDDDGRIAEPGPSEIAESSQMSYQLVLFEPLRSCQDIPVEQGHDR